MHLRGFQCRLSRLRHILHLQHPGMCLHSVEGLMDTYKQLHGSSGKKASIFSTCSDLVNVMIETK